PDELNVDRNSLLYRVSSAKQRRQRGSFVIGGPTTDVPISFFVKHEGRTLPLRLIRGLHVEVVIYRYSRPIRAGDKLTDDHGISRCPYRFCFCAKRTEILNSGLDAALDVRLVVRLGADRGNFNPLSQFRFEFRLRSLDITVDVG